MTTVMSTGALADAPVEPVREPSRRRTKAASTSARTEARRQPAVPTVPTGPTALTVKLTAASMEALARASRLNEINLTDTVNRAVQLYDLVLTALAADKRSALVIVSEGGAERIHVA